MATSIQNTCSSPAELVEDAWSYCAHSIGAMNAKREAVSGWQPALASARKGWPLVVSLRKGWPLVVSG